MTTRSPATAPIVTLIASFVIVFGLGQLIGGPEPTPQPQKPPATAPEDSPVGPTKASGPPYVLDQSCLPGVAVGRKNEPVFCPQSGDTTWYSPKPHHGREGE